ncbi:MAG: Putative nicotinate-nucleotide adenylyltransferase [Candidatus Tokpelaia hoelldobleri]|uniref:Probable nicotinate-nucleotide adenylyltransferase n=1 Tax=Candidatus Tokpelaia hoelldobleri TaxID=1902579 RepID=A0A1U9JVA8_9HYPH|nr:MAG: Putative nicotinate-nucleotide adenylyltransferase [Candidatus Tokpelaia hoelldoblerii]
MSRENPQPWLKMPRSKKGMKIGLFGGSFNPPHAGHVLVAETAVARLKLDAVWWMVTPGNPLKDDSELGSVDKRVAMSEELVRDPRIQVTAFEDTIHTRYSADTIAYVLQQNPDVHFVWLMGADNLATFHQWQKWRWIVSTVPVAVVDRPGASEADVASVMAQEFAQFRIAEDKAETLCLTPAPAWVFLHGVLSPLSSTVLRKK